MELRKPETSSLPHPTEPDRIKHSLEIRLGSNIFRNTNGVLRVQGKEQLVLELSPEHDHILLTIDLYDGSGNHVAHLRRNRWAFNDDTRFIINTSDSPPTLFPNLPWLMGKNPSGHGEVLLTPRATHRNHLSLLPSGVHSDAVR